MKTWKTKNGYIIIRVLSGRSNVFLLTNGEKNILIDTSVKRLWGKLQKRLAGLGIKKIDHLILTHSHFDHTDNAHRIKEKYKAAVIIHKDEASNLLNGQNDVPSGTNVITRFIVNSLFRRITQLVRPEPCRYDFLVDEVFDLNQSGFNAFIMHTPGHTSGSISIIVDNEIALVGDTMFGVFRNSVFPPFADDVNRMIASWARLLDTGCSVFLPAHGSANSRSLVQGDYIRKLKKFPVNTI